MHELAGNDEATLREELRTTREKLARLVGDLCIVESELEKLADEQPQHRLLRDVCTRLDDTICIASIYLCWLHMLYRLRRSNQRWRRYSAMLISENRWRAQRYGIDQGLVDFGRSEIIPYPDLLEEILELVEEDAEHFGCVAEIHHARTILERGTSAHAQLRAYEEALIAGADEHEALKAVVDLLVAETLNGL